MRTVVVTQYKKLEYLPPVMAMLATLKELGRRVVYVGVASEAGESFLRKHGIEYRFMPRFNQSLYHSTSLISKFTNRIRRAFAFFSHRRWFQNVLLDLEQRDGEIIVWHSEVMSAALLGDWGVRFKRRILTIYELADFRGSHWLGFSFLKCLNAVRLVVPEYNRACILKEHFRLSRLPDVIPNKPYGHPRTPNIELPDGAWRKTFDKIGDRPIFLYQGIWNEDRIEVLSVLETIARNRPSYQIVCMPECPAVKSLSVRYPNVHGLPYLDPPNHLAVTSHATVGIAIYNASGKDLLTRLGAVYCAPNKIYEYAGFGIPTLGNDLPGLRYTVEAAGAGICTTSVEKDILDAADKLVASNESYRDAANRFFDAVSLPNIIVQILNSFEDA